MTFANRLIESDEDYIAGGIVLRMLNEGTRTRELVQYSEGFSGTALDPSLVTGQWKLRVYARGSSTWQAPVWPPLSWRANRSVALSVEQQTSPALTKFLQFADQIIPEDEEEARQWAGRLTTFLEHEGERSAEEILRFALKPGEPIELIDALCDALGRAETAQVKATALIVLTALLQHSNLYVQDSAALGLALLDDRRAIPAIEQGIERATSETLKRNLRQVLQELQ